MSPRVILWLLALAAGAVLGTGGLYFGTDLFQRDPLAGMEAAPGVAVEPGEAEILDAIGEATVVTEQRRPDMPDPARAAEMTADAPPGLAASPAALPDDAALLADLPAAEAEPGRPAEAAEMVPGAEATDAQRARVRAWKTSYALIEHGAPAEPAELAGEPTGPESRRAKDIDARHLPAAGIERAGVVAAEEMAEAEAPEAAAVAATRRLEWKTSMALAPAAPVIPDDEVGAAEAAVAMPTALAPEAPRLAPHLDPGPAPTAVLIAIASVEIEEPDQLHVAGQSDPMAAVVIRVNDRLLAETAADASGAWSAVGAQELPPGRYVVTAEAVGDDGAVHASAELRFDRLRVVMAEEAPAVAETPPPAHARIAAEEVDLSMAGPTTVHIERGDNLWHIARAIYGQGRLYTAIYEMNRTQIANPHLIYPGQVFAVPVLEDAD